MIILTNLVLYNDYLYCAWRECPSPTFARRNPSKRLGCIKTSHPPTIPPHQILLPSSPWALTLDPCHPQLFTFILDRSPLHATQLRDPATRACACSPRHFWPRPGPPQPSIPANRPPRRLLVHRNLRRNGTHRGGLRLGCLGNVDTGCSVVCVVACLVDWQCPAWILDLLINSSPTLFYTPNGDHIEFNKYKSDWLSANLRPGQRTTRDRDLIPRAVSSAMCRWSYYLHISYRGDHTWACSRIAWGPETRTIWPPSTLPFLGTIDLDH